MFLHLVAHLLVDADLLAEVDLAWELWTLLRRESPETVAACLMPNHVHQIVETTDAAAARRSFAAKLAAYTRKLGYRRMWLPVPEPSVLVGVAKLRRDVRYVHLNPCRGRSKLVGDPLCWPWSTHRGALGAELDPWIDEARMARALDRNVRGFAEWFHGYVSADPDVAVTGTLPPVAAESSAVARVPLASVVDAALAAAPLSNQRKLRCRLAVGLAYDQGWRDAGLIASTLGVSPQTVRRLALAADPELLRVGRLYLGDPRLRFVPCRSNRPGRPMGVAPPKWFRGGPTSL